MMPIYGLDDILEFFGLEEVSETITTIKELIRKAAETGKRQVLILDGKEELQIDFNGKIYSEKSSEPVLDFSNLLNITEEAS